MHKFPLDYEPLRGILFGTAVRVGRLRKIADHGEYNQKIKDNYQLVVPENVLKAVIIWRGENIFSFVDGDFLLGGTQNSTG